MKPWRLVTVSLIVAVFSASAIGIVWKKRADRRQAEEKLEYTYQSVLAAYSHDVKFGMTRKDVELSLGAKGIQFLRRYSHEEPDTLDDLAKVGQENPPRFCSEHNIYVLFEFAAVEPRESSRPCTPAHASDTLKRASIYHWLEGCL